MTPPRSDQGFVRMPVAEANFHIARETEAMAAQPNQISLRQTRGGSEPEAPIDFGS